MIKVRPSWYPIKKDPKKEEFQQEDSGEESDNKWQNINLETLLNNVFCEEEVIKDYSRKTNFLN